MPQKRYFEPPHRTAKMIGEALAWLIVLLVIVIVVVSYNVRHYWSRRHIMEKLQFVGAAVAFFGAGVAMVL
jgi:cell division protein FtsX